MVPYLRAANVKDGELDLSDVKSMDFDPDEQRRLALRPGDVLVSEGAGSLSAVGASAVWQGEIAGTVCFQNTLLRLRPRPGNDARFLLWWARHAYGSGLFASIATGANIYHLGAEGIRTLAATMPDLRTQRAIADYLDAETARIDALVALRRRLAVGVEERRRVKVRTLVLGEDRSCDRRNVAGGWFGDIPAHWDVKPLKALAGFVNGCAFKPEDWEPEGVPIVRIVNLNGGGEFNRTTRSVDPRYLVREGDLLFGWSGNRGTSFGPFRWNAPGEFLLNQHIFRLTVRDVDPDWLYWALVAATPYVEELAHGIIGMVHITKDRLANVAIPLPPPSEQAVLTRNLDRDETIAAAAGNASDRQIDLLQERRQALITAAATGQLEIAGVAA